MISLKVNEEHSEGADPLWSYEVHSELWTIKSKQRFGNTNDAFAAAENLAGQLPFIEPTPHEEFLRINNTILERHNKEDNQ
jgi:hypothetical protein